MGQAPNYSMTITVESTVNNYTDINITSVTGAWAGSNVHYQPSDGVNPDGLIIDVPAALEVGGPITWTGVDTSEAIMYRWLEAERISSNPTKIKIRRTSTPIKGLFADYIRQCKVPNTYRATKCDVMWSVFANPTTSMLAPTFDMKYIRNYDNLTNSAVRMDKGGVMSYCNKTLQPSDILLQAVTIDTVPELSNNKGQYLISITLRNTNGVITSEYDATLCPMVTSISNDAVSITVNTNITIPAIGNFQRVVDAGVKVPNIFRFNLTPVGNSIILTPNDTSLLSEVVTPGTSLTTTFLVFNVV
jgi:hypothetical protein